MKKGVMKGMAGLMVVVMSGVSYLWATGTQKTVSQEKPLIQVAILLDTSGSMDGLIEQARTELWKIVNEFATAKKNNRKPELRVALYEYGKASIPETEGYLRMILPFTTDLDKVSEDLFALTTHGGDEYCGKVILSAVQGLSWSGSNQNYKAIFIAGNEPFTQGNINYQQACRDAIAKGIIVNTIFCGNFDEGVRTNWKEGADLADGRYMNIDHNMKAVHISAPQDEKIARLGSELNTTYLAYGSKGREGAERQEEQDQSALVSSGAVLAERTVAKASENYQNASWDLVDGVANGTVAIEALKKAELPKEMQKMSLSEQKEYLKQKSQERTQIQQTIKRLNEERKKFLTEEMKKVSKNSENSFDAAIIRMVKEQMAKRNFQFE